MERMKYLKTYKLFENLTDDFLLDVHDIVLDIEDSGLFIKRYRSYEGTDRVKLQITKNPEGRLTGKFEITQEIADTLYRLGDYVSKLGWSFCTFEIHLSGKEWYQLSKGDIQHYVGAEVWYITVDITDYRGPHWYEMRYGTNESKENLSDVELHRETREDVISYLSDLEDYGYGCMVTSSTKSMMPSNGKKDYIIEVDIWRKKSDTIDIDIIKERINQTSSLIEPFEQVGVSIQPKYLYRISMPKSFKYKNINDFSITELLTGDGGKHQYLDDFMNLTRLRDDVFREIVDDAEFHVKDWGMDRWLDDMQCVGSPTTDGDEIMFLSTKQFDDFEVNIPIEDLEHDVRLVIDNVKIKFVYETKE